jgi:uncharacterized membrane protein HdeD (DUF308 family)
MLLFTFLGFGIGLILSGIILFASSFLYQKRMRNPALIRWAGVVTVMIGLVLGTIVLYWR